MRRNSAFTLLELMITIGIILLLIAILLPALRTMRAMGQQVTCASQIRTVGQAYIAYATANDGAMATTQGSGISSQNWVFWQTGRNVNHSALAPYLSYRDEDLRNLFRCPSVYLEGQAGFNGGRPYPLTFTLNGFLERYPGMTYAKVLNASSKILIYDENENADDDIVWYMTARDTIAGRHGTRSVQVADINNAGSTTVFRQMANVCFFDGHVELADNDMCHDPHLNNPSLP
jgi:prepilin-type processing-associated H-X9-DG protein